MSDHDVEKCKCINLNMGIFKFIKNVPASYKRLTFDINLGYLRFCVSESWLCYTTEYAVSISIIPLTTQEKIETINMDFYMKEDGSFLPNNALQSIDNTLVIIEILSNRQKKIHLWNLKSNQKKIHLWNLKKSEYVVELNVSSNAKIGGMSVAESGNNFDIEHVRLSKNKLLVMVYIYDYEDQFQFLIWNLDTEDPSTSNLTLWITLDHIGSYWKCGDNVYMNSKLFCCTYTTDYGELGLRIAHFDDLPNFKTKALMMEKEELGPDLHWDCLEVKLESGDSGRLAIFDKIFRKMRVYNLDNDDVEIQVDLSSIPNGNISRVMSGFFMDNVIFVNIDHQENELNFIIVTEMGDVVKGNKQKIMYSVNKDAFFYVDNFGLMMQTIDPFEPFKNEIEVTQEIRFSRQIHLYHM